MRKQLARRVSLSYAPSRLPWIIICLGIVLRLVQYLFNRSLWLDESYLALNIIDRSFLRLLQPLDYNQGTPVGFLIFEKLAVQTFGSSEYSLRLIPFLSGIISLFLFYKVAKEWIRPKAVPIALGLFAISGPLVYYSSEVKQYSSDVAIALLLFWLTIYIQSRRLTTSRIALFAVLGATAIWFSHPSVFILTSVGMSLTLFCLVRKEWAKIRSLSIAYSLWALSFVVFYFVSLRNLSSNKVLLYFWRDYFTPSLPWGFSDAKWFVRIFFGIFDEPVGLYLTGIAPLTFLVGCISMFLEKKERFFLLISPVLLTLLASTFQKYPFGGRLLLFVVPSLLLLVGEGVEYIRDKTKHNSAIVGAVLIGLLFFYPVLSASERLIRPLTFEEIRPVISYVTEHKQGGDILYLYYASWPAFKYYSKSYGFKSNNQIIGVSSRENLGNYIKDLGKLRGNKRVWILFSHVYADEEKFFLYYLDSVGTRLDSFKSMGVSAYLYDLRRKAPR